MNHLLDKTYASLFSERMRGNFLIYSKSYLCSVSMASIHSSCPSNSNSIDRIHVGIAHLSIIINMDRFGTEKKQEDCRWYTVQWVHCTQNVTATKKWYKEQMHLSYLKYMSSQSRVVIYTSLVTTTTDKGYLMLQSWQTNRHKYSGTKLGILDILPISKHLCESKWVVHNMTWRFARCRKK